MSYAKTVGALAVLVVLTLCVAVLPQWLFDQSAEALADEPTYWNHVALTNVELTCEQVAKAYAKGLIWYDDWNQTRNLTEEGEIRAVKEDAQQVMEEIFGSQSLIYQQFSEALQAQDFSCAETRMLVSVGRMPVGIKVMYVEFVQQNGTEKSAMLYEERTKTLLNLRCLSPQEQAQQMAQSVECYALETLKLNGAFEVRIHQSVQSQRWGVEFVLQQESINP